MTPKSDTQYISPFGLSKLQYREKSEERAMRILQKQ